MVGDCLSKVELNVRCFCHDSNVRECSQSRRTLLANDKIKVAIFCDVSTTKGVRRGGKLMKVEVATRKIDVEHFEVIGNSQVHIEDGVSTSCEGDETGWIGGVYGHSLNSECHGLIDKDIGLRA